MSTSLRIAVVLFALLALASLLGPWLRPFDAWHTDWDQLQVAPGLVHGHWLGSDAIGRDVFVRTLLAGRMSLLLGFAAGAVALLFGLAYGALAGTLGGAAERWMMRALDVVSALPFLLIVVLLLTLFGRSAILLVVAVGAYACIDLARMLRAEAARLRVLPFVQAARALGAGPWWLLGRHIVPNLLGFAVVYLSLAIPQAILVESFLSFLGLGLDEPSVSLGALLAEGVQEIEDAPWVLIAPATFLGLLLMAFTLLGDALRARLDLRAAR
jgi:oligopeptide transport system permease protein